MSLKIREKMLFLAKTPVYHSRLGQERQGIATAPFGSCMHRLYSCLIFPLLCLGWTHGSKRNFYHKPYNNFLTAIQITCHHV